MSKSEQNFNQTDAIIFDAVFTKWLLTENDDPGSKVKVSVIENISQKDENFDKNSNVSIS